MWALEKDNLPKSGDIDKPVINSDSTISKLDVVENTVIIKSDLLKKHILMFHPWGTPSHMNQLKPLVLGLLEAGNAVTAVFTRKTEINHNDYTEIIVQDT